MDRLEPRVFYVDMDSLIFSSKEDEWMPQTSSYLGELTNKLEVDDNITEFAATGPKSLRSSQPLFENTRSSQPHCFGVCASNRAVLYGALGSVANYFQWKVAKVCSKSL